MIFVIIATVLDLYSPMLPAKPLLIKTCNFKPENKETVHQMESYARKQENM